jgi:16S rRNA (guanine527-N7)-methyltransferase
MGIAMNDSKLAELQRLIAAWPGLVAASDRAMIEALVDDCLVLVGFLGEAGKVIDVGSGGGLPGLPLKIARPDLKVTLVEADGRKAAFLYHACAELGLGDVEIVNRRAEEAGHQPGLREAFDAAVARALAPMPVLAELCLPFVRIGGRLLAQKTGSEDVSAAARAIAVLGGGPAAVVAAPSRLRSSGTVVVVEKLRPTPSAYPRRPGLPARKPL